MFHKVIVAGMGALGSEVVKNLGLLGCDSVFMADADIIEEKNLAKPGLLRENATIGRSKISCVIDPLRSWFPQTQWNGTPVEIADVEPKQFWEAEMLFSCVDSDLARAEIAVLATRYKIPICDGGLGGLSNRVGRVSWFPSTGSVACFACLLTGRRRAELFSIWESQVHSCWTREQDERDAWTSTPTMSSIVADLQVKLAIFPKEHREEAFSIHLDLDRTAASQTIQHRRSAECPLHTQVPGVPFPICTRAECRTCGGQFSPDQRVGWVRRWGKCSLCGSHDLIIRDSMRNELVDSIS